MTFNMLQCLYIILVSQIDYSLEIKQQQFLLMTQGELEQTTRLSREAEKILAYIRTIDKVARDSVLVGFETHLVSGMFYSFSLKFHGLPVSASAWSKPWQHFLEVTLTDGKKVDRHDWGVQLDEPQQNAKLDKKAEEILAYIKTIDRPVKDAELVRFDYQLVAGSLYTFYFNFHGLTLTAKAWSKPWQHFLEVTKTNGQKVVRHDWGVSNVGGVTQGVALNKETEEILAYIKTIDKVAQDAVFVKLDTQVVAGHLYIYHFDFHGLKITAKAWVKHWEHFLEVTKTNGEKVIRHDWGVQYGGVTQGVELNKHTEDILDYIKSIDQVAKDAKFIRLDSQVVAGQLYTFHFLFHGLPVTAKAWSKPWQHFLEVTKTNGQKVIRHDWGFSAIVGGVTQGVPLNKETKEILEYIQSIDKVSKDAKFVRLDSQVVAGQLYTFHFQFHGLPITVKAWVKHWEHFLEVTLTDGKKVVRHDWGVKAIVGGVTQGVALNDETEKILHYIKTIELALKDADFVRLDVQVVAGYLYTFHFKSHGLDVSIKVWVKYWQHFLEVTKINGQRVTRHDWGVSDQGIELSKEAKEILDYIRTIDPVVRDLELVKFTPRVVGGNEYTYTFNISAKAWSRPWQNFLEVTKSNGEKVTRGC